LKDGMHPRQANPNKVQDTLKMLADPSFLAVYAVMDKETQKMIMQMLLMGSMGGSKDGASMLSFIIMMQQKPAETVEQPRNEGWLWSRHSPRESSWGRTTTRTRTTRSKCSRR